MIVCEGYTDVIGFAAAGVPRAVATCGTALTEDHVPRCCSASPAHRAGLRRRRRRAGARPSGSTSGSRSYELEVAVAALPAGPGPRRPGPVRSRARCAPRSTEPMPFLGFRVDRVLAAGRPRHARGPGPRRRGRAGGHRRAPRRARARPVRDGGRRPLPARRRPAAGGRCAPGRGAAGRAERRPGPQRRRPRVERRPHAAPRGRPDRRRRGAATCSTTCCSPTTATPRRFRALRDADGDLHAALAAADPTSAELLAAAGGRGHRRRRRATSVARARCGDAVERTLRRPAARGAEAGRPRAATPMRSRGCRRSARRCGDEHRPGRDVEDQLLAWLCRAVEETA